MRDQAVRAAALRAWQDTAHAQQLPRTAEVLAWVEIYVDAQSLGAPNGGFGYCVDPQAPPRVPTLHLSFDLVSRSDERRLGEPRRVQVKVGEQRVRVPPPPNPSGLSPEARVERLLEIHGTLSWLDPSAGELQTRWDALFVDLIANGSSPSREAAHRRAGDAASYAADWADDLRGRRAGFSASTKPGRPGTSKARPTSTSSTSGAPNKTSPSSRPSSRTSTPKSALARRCSMRSIFALNASCPAA